MALHGFKDLARQAHITPEEAYQILGLGGRATADEVRKAYRKRALEWHPDRRRTDEEKEHYGRRFLDARDAYEFLRRQGYPELAGEPAPEPDFSLKTAGRSFAGKAQDAPLSEKLGLKLEWSLESVLLWGLVMPAGLLGIVWMCRFILRNINP